MANVRIVPDTAINRPGVRLIFRKKISPSPVNEMKQSKAAEMSIKSDQTGPESRPLCRSFSTATKP